MRVLSETMKENVKKTCYFLKTHVSKMSLFLNMDFEFSLFRLKLLISLIMLKHHSQWKEEYDRTLAESYYLSNSRRKLKYIAEREERTILKFEFRRKMWMVFKFGLRPIFFFKLV